MPRGNPGINVGLRIPAKTLAVIDAWAAKHKLSRLDALRRILQAGFDRLGLAVPHEEGTASP